jgi:hypothetical protein
VFENKVRRKVFGPKKAEESKQFGFLNNEDLSVKIVKSWKLLWVRNVDRVNETRNA